MNLWLPVILIVFHVNIITAGLSPAERKTLEDAINKDRAEIGKRHGFEFPRLTYDEQLEKKLESMESCNNDDFLAVKGNEAYQKTQESSPRIALFLPAPYQFGCSKTLKCSEWSKEKSNDGKTPEIYIACLIRSPKKVDDKLSSKLSHSDYPSPFKYGDLIGSDSNSSGTVQNSSSGTILSFITTLSFSLALFFVFYV